MQHTRGMFHQAVQVKTITSWIEKSHCPGQRPTEPNQGPSGELPGALFLDIPNSLSAMILLCSKGSRANKHQQVGQHCVYQQDKATPSHSSHLMSQEEKFPHPSLPPATL